MRKFNIKVNGKAYEVEVEEVGSAPSAAAAPVVTSPAPVAVPKSAPAPTAAAPASTAPAGSTEINAPMPGTILSVAVTQGDTVKEGDVLCVLEAMKMENEIKSPVAGTVVAVGVAKGATVNSGDLLTAIG